MIFDPAKSVLMSKSNRQRPREDLEIFLGPAWGNLIADLGSLANDMATLLRSAITPLIEAGAAIAEAQRRLFAQGVFPPCFGFLLIYNIGREAESMDDKTPALMDLLDKIEKDGMPISVLADFFEENGDQRGATIRARIADVRKIEKPPACIAVKVGGRDLIIPVKQFLET
jgi:hypothetical protein